MAEMSSRERWEEWEKRTGYEREHGGGRGGGGEEPRGGMKQKVMAWAKKTTTPQHEKGQGPPVVTPQEKFAEHMIGTLGVHNMIRQGKLKGTLEEFQKKAREQQAKHQENLKKTLDDLLAHAPPGSTVIGRVKSEGSILGKIVRKPKYDSPEKLQDITGTTVIVNDIASGNYEKTIEAIQKSGQYKVISHDDYIKSPQGGFYRAHHFIVEDKDGLQKEVQVKTKRQQAFTYWSHDPYKPRNKEQAQAARKLMKQHGGSGILEEYAKKMSDYMYDLDSGRTPPPPPPCPEEIRQAFGCIPAA